MKNRIVGWGTCVFMAVSLHAATLQVGPGQTYAKPCAAIAAASPGDTILIDAAGNYNGDVCTIYQDGVTLRGINGRPHIDAAGNNEDGKAIWVIDGDNVVVENIEFSGASVPDGNGAGIRFESNNLTVRYCYFHNNQDGLLTNDGTGELLIEYSEFGFNGTGNGFTHNLYVNQLAKFTLRYSYSHDANAGQLVKTRAAENHIEYNRLTTENGTTSYEVDIPNGGLSYIIGNLIEQGPNGQNSNIVEYLAEGTDPHNPDLRLFLINNTIVNDKSFGEFVLILNNPVPAVVQNNIFYGPGTLINQSNAIMTNNLVGVNPLFANQAAYDYHLTSGSPAIDAGLAPGLGAGQSLNPDSEYVHPECGEARVTVGTIDVGAYEFGGAGTKLTCAPGSGSATPNLVGLTVSPLSVTAGTGASATVTLDSVAPAGGVVVAMSSSNGSAASTASSVTVAAGSASASFPVTTGAVSIATPVTLTATFNGASRTAGILVNPATAPNLTGFTVSPASVTGGTGASATVTLDNPAPSGGIVVAVSSNNSAAAWTAGSVTVAAGATSGTVSVSTGTVTAATAVTLTATFNGVSKTAAITVNPTVTTGLNLTGLTVSPGTVTAGTGAWAAVTLSGVAPAGGIVVAMSSSNAAAASTPSSVTIAAGSMFVSIPVTTGAVSAVTPVTLTATYNGGSKTTGITVNPGAAPPAPHLSSLTVAPGSVTGGTGATATVTLDNPATSGGIVVGMSSNNAADASTASSVMVAAGSMSATFPVTTATVTTATTVTLTAAYNGVSKTAGITVNPAAPPTPHLSSLTVAPGSVTGGTGATATVTLDNPATSGGIVVAMSSNNAAAASTASSVTVAAGATSITFPVSTGSVSTTTAVTLTASYGGVSKTAGITVNPPAPPAPNLTGLTVSPGSVTGGTGATATVTLDNPATSGGIVVAVSSNNAAAASTASSVTVAAGSTSVSFPVTTGTVTTATTVTLTATYNGVSKTAGITVNPAAPAQYTVSVTPTSVHGFDVLMVSWTAPAGRPDTDRIAIVPTGAPDSAFVSNTGTYGLSSGTLQMVAPGTPGTYQVKYILVGGIEVASSSVITVSPAVGYSLSVPATAPVGGTITVSWTAPAGRPNSDWIGLYSPSGQSYWSAYLWGQTSGTFTVPAPPAGNYHFIYFAANTVTAVMTSPNVVVH